MKDENSCGATGFMGDETDVEDLVRTLIPVMLEAGRAVMDVYAGEIDVAVKGDGSPVTLADQVSEQLILKQLAVLAPDIPVVSEEQAAAGYIPDLGDRFFLVDPLDGTKEFISKNGEFTINIALIEAQVPVLGLVYAPARGRLFVGSSAGAFEQRVAPHRPDEAGTMKPIRVRPIPAEGLTAIGSRSHGSAEVQDYLKDFDVKEFISAGSSLKLCLIAAGEADLYPRLGRTMEWDIAAGHAVLLAAGGFVGELNGAPLGYGKVTRGLDNPHFVAWGSLRPNSP